LLTKDEHLAKAEANESFADNLQLNSPVDVDWALTALFYAAVHYVQAYFANIGRDFVTHTNRCSAIQKDPNLKAAYGEYRELMSLSRDARYEQSCFAKGHVRYAKEQLSAVKQVVLKAIGAGARKKTV
jgi:hypothetical protein